MRDILERLGEIDRHTTHWEGCEEYHIRCAAAKEITRLRRIEAAAEVFTDGIDEAAEGMTRAFGEGPKTVCFRVEKIQKLRAALEGE